MNLFGVGGTEILLIVVIMLIVAGPKRMLQWAYILGQYLGQLRILWGQTMEGIQKEFDESGVDIKLPKDIPTRGDITRLARQALKPVEEPMNEVVKEYEAQHKAIGKSMRDDAKTIKESTKINTENKNGNKPKALPSSVDDKPETGFGTWSGSTKQEE